MSDWLGGRTQAHGSLWTRAAHMADHTAPSVEESPPRLCVGGSPAAALFAARPWIALGGICGFVLLAVDRAGLFLAVGVGLLAGIIDALWTLVRLGRNQIRIGLREIRFVSCKSEVAVIPIEPDTAFTIQAGAGGILEYFSAAYMTFTTVTLTTDRSDIELLAKTRGQVERLQAELDNGLEWARSGGANDPK